MSESSDTVTPKEMRDWAPVFLLTLTQSPNVAEASRTAGVSRKTAYQYKKECQEFSDAWDEALEASTDDLAAECYRRARHGVKRPVYYLGKKVGSIREYSDVLAMFLLKAHRPEVYRDTQKQIHDFTGISDDELIRQAKGLVGGIGSAESQG